MDAGREPEGPGRAALVIAVSILVPFVGILAGTKLGGKFLRAGIVKPRFVFLAGVVSLALYMTAGAYMLKIRDAGKVQGCAAVLREMGVLEEQYFVRRGRYTADLADLSDMKLRMGAWLCEGVSGEKCRRRFEKQVGRYCRIKTLEIVLDPEGSGYQIRVRAGNVKGCPLCVSPEGQGPESIEECRGVKDYACKTGGD